MSKDVSQEEKGQETAPDPKPKKVKMVNVYNNHKYASFHLGGGRKIPPGTSGRIPLAMFNKVKDKLTWLKRAERGDVV